MTERDLQTVPCPYCDEPLYVVAKVTRGDSQWLVTDASPRVEEDSEGFFILCPRCSHRVAMLPEPSLPAHSYYIAPGQ